MKPIYRYLRSLATVTALLAVAPVHASDYPNRTITLINPWSPGGASDAIARPLADGLGQALGQTVVLENKPGANGTIGAGIVARAKPDGYTLYFSHVGPVAISPAFQPLSFDPEKDLQAVTQVVSGPLVMVVRSDLPFKTVNDVIAHAKDHPGELKYASVGTGSTTHLAGELFDQLAKVQTTHVPYKGDAPATVDMVGGRIDLAFMNIAGMLPHIQSGKLRAIAVTGPQRSSVLPDLPTVAETLPGFDVSSWYGLMVPANTPKEIVDRLAEETHKVMQSPQMAEMIKSRGLDVVISSPEEHSAYVSANIKRWKDLIETAGIKRE